MKFRNIVVATVIALSTQTVTANCGTAKMVGASGGALTGAIAGFSGGLAVAGGLAGLGLACSGSMILAPFTGGASLLVTLSSCGGTVAALTGGATLVAVGGAIAGEKGTELICDPMFNDTKVVNTPTPNNTAQNK
jgi:hypothetical protein